MTDDSPDLLSQLSNAIADRAAAAAPLAVAVEAAGWTLSGILWRPDVVVTSEQALPDHDAYVVKLSNGTEIAARLAGRDPGTNVAGLRLASAVAPPGFAVAEDAALRAGALTLALGADPVPRARLAMIHAVGPGWHSMAGGFIDRLIRLDMRASRAEEGGPVVAAAGGALLGMATAGPRRRSLVIPHQTIERVLEPLLSKGRVARGWLGVGLQAVSVPESLCGAAGQDSGLMVVSLAADGPAQRAGVLPGDILLSFDGERLRRPRAIRGLLGPERIGRQFELALIRAGALQTCALTVAARPEG